MNNDDMNDPPEDDFPEDEDDGDEPEDEDDGDDDGDEDEPEDEDDSDEDDEDDEPEDDDEDSDDDGDEDDEDDDEPEDGDDEDGDDEDGDDEDGEDEDDSDEDDSDEDEDDEDDSDEDDSDEDDEDDLDLEQALDEDDDAFDTPDADPDNFEDDEGDWDDDDYAESAAELFSENPFFDEDPFQRFLDAGMTLVDRATETRFQQLVERVAPGASETLQLFLVDGAKRLEGFVTPEQFRTLRDTLDDVDLSDLHLISSGRAAEGRASAGRLPADLSEKDAKEAVDLRKYCTPVGDQGPTNRCSAFAWTHALEMTRVIQGQPAVELSNNYSMLLFQRFMKDEDGFEWAYEGGDGTVGGTGPGKQLVKHGSCRRELWPDASEEPEVEEPAMKKDASKYKLQARLFAVKLDDVKRVLSAGYPLHLAMSTGPAFNRVGRDGIVKVAEGPSGRHGYHAMLLVGYAGNYFIVKNSWGTSWGDKGYCYIPKKILAQSDPEFIALAPVGAPDKNEDGGKRPPRKR